MYLVRSIAPRPRLSGVVGDRAKSQEKSNKVKINQLNAILTDLPGIS
ncbi:hypothetical protein QUB30_30555 [Microcoleus sp. BROC3]